MHEFEEGSPSALIKSGAAKEARGAATLLMVSPGRLQVAEGFNIRNADTAAYREGIKTLADSIEAEGFYRHKPFVGVVTAPDNQITITDGHRRLAAINLLRDEGRPVPETVPVILNPSGTSLVDLTVALAKTGEGLTPMELAALCKRLQGLGVEDPEIARRVGITPKYFGNLMLLLSAPRKVQRMVAEGKVSATLAIDQLRTAGKDGAAVALTQAVAAAEAEGKERVTKKDVVKRPKPDTETVELKFPRGTDVNVLKIGETVLSMLGGAWADHTERSGIMEATRDVRLVVKLAAKAAPAEDEDL